MKEYYICHNPVWNGDLLLVCFQNTAFGILKDGETREYISFALTKNKKSQPYAQCRISLEQAIVVATQNECLNQLLALLAKYPLEPKQVVCKLTEDYHATLTPDGIKVGCQTITYDTFQALADAVKEYRS